MVTAMTSFQDHGILFGDAMFAASLATGPIGSGALAELRERMMTILEQVDAKKDHLPEISIRGGEPVGVTYEWDLILDSGGGGASRPPSGWPGLDIGNIFGAGK